MNKEGQGRKKKWATPQALQNAIDAYFKDANTAGEPLTVESLCAHLKCSRKSLCDYERAAGYEDYHEIVSGAKMRICADIVKNALRNKYNSGMAIFILKNNFGYSDNQKPDTERKKTKFAFGKK